MAMVIQNNIQSQGFVDTFNGDISSFLSIDNFNKLKEIMRPKVVKAGTHLFWEGEKAEKMYFINSGQIKLRTSTEAGKEFLLGIKEEGSLLGEFGGCDDQVFYTYRAEVTESGEVSSILVSDLKKLLYQFGNFAVEFMNWLGWMNRVTQTKLHDVLFYDKSGTLASTLLRMSHSYGVKCSDGILLNIELTNKEIADFIGSTRESVNRLLNSWRKAGFIDIIGKQIVIIRPEELYSLCDSLSC
ncbi:Crp/Fnr family transcriptional regulator [Litchfieldia salsa]|uniref:CRP/FNR family transcriptional regulator, anaerobic regulatory protein n=1 Tax=Litchfieldia salsa TaxID=930152 RepID=A0A1H0WVK3_9BACI|nr:Crp/Fnr family transcriptional regulator [Litchfieldia salsa]SDP94794.1 CRP/FNR family transcriptional regulator, anaerobic regulatory protein [Litchfieldia salsa]